MAITLHNIGPAAGAKKDKKRIGRGLGSKGTTAGRGQKGQKSRSGVSGLKRIGARRQLLATPKLRGFHSGWPKAAVVNLKQLEELFGKGEEVTPKALAKKGLINKTAKNVKILGDGEIKSALNIKGCSVSKAAADKILKAGGKIEA
jgi:large subunit ribosomal protein L15